MSEPYPELFELSPKLDMITPCEMKLSSPVENGILQVESYKPSEFIDLLLVKDLASIHLSRRDKQDIQVEVNMSETYHHESRVKVFESPVPIIKFEKIGDGRKGKIWSLCEANNQVNNSEALRHFTTILGKYALLKQAKVLFAPIVESLSSSK